MLQFGLRRPVSNARLKAVFAKTLSVPEAEQYIFLEESGADKLFEIGYVKDSEHDFGTRFEVIDGLGVTAPLAADPFAELALAKQFARLLGQDVATDDFTTESLYRFLLIKPDGSVWSVRENPDNEADYLELYEADAVPFDERQAAVSAD